MSSKARAATGKTFRTLLMSLPLSLVPPAMRGTLAYYSFPLPLLAVNVNTL
jgi:hypothetical protein